MDIVIPLLFGAVLWGPIAGSMYQRRQRTYWHGYAWGFFFGVFALIVIKLLVKDHSPKCPYCKLTVQVGAMRCQHCRSDYPAPRQPEIPPQTSVIDKYNEWQRERGERYNTFHSN